MIHIIWEFVVKPDAVERFERAYGADGEWSRFFATHAGFRGTILLRDAASPRRFLTIDVWEGAEDRRRMMAEAGAAYAALDASFAGLTESETEIGAFEAMGSGRPAGPAA